MCTVPLAIMAASAATATTSAVMSNQAVQHQKGAQEAAQAAAEAETKRLAAEKTALGPAPQAPDVDAAALEANRRKRLAAMRQGFISTIRTTPNSLAKMPTLVPITNTATTLKTQLGA